MSLLPQENTISSCVPLQLHVECRAHGLGSFSCTGSVQTKACTQRLPNNQNPKPITRSLNQSLFSAFIYFYLFDSNSLSNLHLFLFPILAFIFYPFFKLWFRLLFGHSLCMRRTSDQLHHVLCTHAATEAHRSTQCVHEVVSALLFIQCNINSC